MAGKFSTKNCWWKKCHEPLLKEKQQSSGMGNTIRTVNCSSWHFNAAPKRTVKPSCTWTWLRSYYGKTYATSCMTTGHSTVEHGIHLHLLDLSTATGLSVTDFHPHYRVCKINGFNQSHSIHMYGMAQSTIVTSDSRDCRSLKLRTFPNMTTRGRRKRLAAGAGYLKAFPTVESNKGFGMHRSPKDFVWLT